MILDNPFTSILDDFMNIYDLMIEGKQPYDDTGKYMNVSMLLHKIFTSIYDLNANVNAVKK